MKVKFLCVSALAVICFFFYAEVVFADAIELSREAWNEENRRQAIGLLEEALDKKPDFHEARLELVTRLMALAQASDEEASLGGDESASKNFSLKADSYRKQALGHMELLVGAGVHFSGLQERLATLYAYFGEYDRAIAAYEDLLASEGLDAEKREAIITALVKLKSGVKKTIADDEFPDSGLKIIRVKNVSDVIKSDHYIISGFGIVTGLAGTGDKDIVLLKSLLVYMGEENFPRGLLLSAEAGSAAIVLVQGEINAGDERGSRFNIKVSAAADASSLEGGVLVSTQLFSPNRYTGSLAVSEGKIVIGEDKRSGAIESGGELLINAPPLFAGGGTTITWRLFESDRGRVSDIVDAFTEAAFEVGVSSFDREFFARVESSSLVVVNIPPSYMDKPWKLVDILGEIPIEGPEAVMDMPVIPENARMLVEEGRSLLESGNYSLAARRFTGALSLSTRSYPEARFLAAYARFLDGADRWNRSIANLEDARLFGEGSVEGKVALRKSRSFMNQAKVAFQGSISVLEPLLGERGFTEAWILSAKSNIYLDNPDEAIALLGKALHSGDLTGSRKVQVESLVSDLKKYMKKRISTDSRDPESTK